MRYLLALPPQLPVPGESGHDRTKRLKSLAEAANRLRVMYGETPPHPWSRVGAGTFGFASAWQAALRIGAFFSHPPDLGDCAPPPDRVRHEVTLAPYAGYYNRASELSDAYMRTYRGAFSRSRASRLRPG